MALVTLKNGKTIDIDLWYYLNMTDEEIQDLEALNFGFEVENPFHNSSINSFKVDPVVEEEEIPEEPTIEDDFDEKEFLERDDI